METNESNKIDKSRQINQIRLTRVDNQTNKIDKSRQPNK